MPQPSEQQKIAKKPQESDNVPSHSGEVLADNRPADGFSLPMIGGQFEFANGAFSSEKKQPVKAKGDGFNTSVASVASRYAGQYIKEKITSSATNWSLQIVKTALDYTPLVKLELPGGQLAMGMDMGVESINLTRDSGDTVVANAKLKTAGEAAAKVSLATGSNTKIVDWQVRGDVNGSASFTLGEINTSLTIKLKPAENLIGRTVKSYQMEVDINPKLSIDLEGSLSFRTVYLMQKLKQDWAVLFVKGLHFGAEGGVKAGVVGEGAKLPGFSLETSKAWQFTTAKAKEPVVDPFPLKPTALPQALADSKALLSKEEQLFGKREDKPQEKHEAPVDRQNKSGLAGLEQLQNPLDKEAVEKQDSNSYLTWALSYIKKTGKQTALTTLKDKLAEDDGLLKTYTEKISDSIKGKRIKLGKYLSITVESLTLQPETGLTFRVSQSVDLFGSWLTSKGTIELQYDIFHQHAYHFQYDLQGASIIPKLAPLWRMHSAGITMSAAGQTLTLKGLDLTSDELIINQGQLALKLPQALGGAAFTIHAKGLRFGDTVSWQLLGGETDNPINVFGQKSLVIEKLMIGSGDHEDGRKGIIFATTNLKIDLFKNTQRTELHVVWDMDKGQFVGHMSSLKVAGVSITDLLLSDRGLHIQNLNLSLKDILNTLPGENILSDNDLTVDIKGFKISSAGISITEAEATIKRISAGPLTITDGKLGVGVENNKANAFHVAGNASLALWGAQANAKGMVAYKDGKIDKTKTKFNGQLKLGVLTLDSGDVEFMPDGGFELKGPSAKISPAAMKNIPVVKNIVPNWLLNALSTTELLFSAQKYDSRSNKFTKPRFIPVKFPIPLGGGYFAEFSYDKDSKTARLTLPRLNKRWKVASGHAEVPLLYGFAGLEVGGELDFGVGLGDNNDIKVQYDDSKGVPELGLDAKIELLLSSDAVLKVGIYAGVPKLITISGGVYAKVIVANELAAKANGRIALGGSGDWHLQLGLDMAAKLAGQAGAYIAYTIVGIRGEKKFPLAQKELASWTYIGDVSIGRNADVKAAKGGKLAANDELRNQGTESAAQIKAKLDSLHSNIDAQSADVHKRVTKADDTVKLHDAITTLPKSQVDDLMKLKANGFTRAIEREKQQPKPDLARIAVLEAQKEVWSKWSPGKIQLTGSREERVSNNLARRRQNLYQATMALMFNKTVALRSLIHQQLDATAQSIDLLNQQLTQLHQQPKSEKRDQQITLISHEIASYEVMLNRLEVIVKQPLPKEHWQQIDDEHHEHLKAAVKDNSGLLQSAKAQLKEAQLQYEVANNKLVSIAKARQVYREQIGAEHVTYVDELERVQQLMNQDHAKWYQNRNSFWRKVFGKSQDSIVGEAMSKLRRAELKLAFAEQQLEYTQKLEPRFSS